MKTGYFFIISAPSGTGKSTIINNLLNDKELNLKKTLSYTTRKPRRDEINGIHYNYISKKEFKKLIQDGEFIEWAKVHDNYYGTSIKQVETAIENGEFLIKDIDIQGAMLLKEKLKKKAILIFISPPSLATLKERLEKRKTDSKETIEIRLNNAEKEMTYIDKYQFNVINKDIKKAQNEIKEIIKGFINDKK